MSNDKKLSSIEWLLQEALEWDVDRTDNSQFIKFPSGAIEQAKAMHKEEMTEFARNYMRQLYDKGVITVETFYNETYGGNNEQQ